ncbi:energy-coupling factor transporter transmembrane component T family protein [Lacticaseibacillus sharpeae]|uniref:Energy-coupling factor transporter transmembrane protein EcfT n=1 Tax=Lacticaseibacillus sharpeae JCM 1186 = DSM 20505 TaxID=1291052 RepID=A0A0R1ZIH7_9LACO|nr:energy-coupling factor transporter transmembrane component T [Lacticaseibacillus sharpeae]KRM54229.1 ABC-type cobalt transport system, permease component CbiQ related transporter [Lacticaseibacillus sharpeae JCM 1186 = DSM 20505]
MSKMILGRYIPGDSFIHRLDPRTKLLATFFYIAIVFLANNWQSYLFLTVVTLAIIPLARVSFKFFINGLMPVLFLLVFTVLIQIFFTTGGQVYWRWGWLSVTSLGLINAGFVFIRLVLIIFMSTLLTLTTPSLSLADAVESLLKPLAKIHFPVTEVALMLSIALRFVPTLMDQTTKTMNAQRARGVDFGSGGLVKQIRTIVPLFIPLFVSAFTMADDLATAMEARGYRDGLGRTKYRVLHYGKRDAMTTGALAVLTLGLLILRR